MPLLHMLQRVLGVHAQSKALLSLRTQVRREISHQRGILADGMPHTEGIDKSIFRQDLQLHALRVPKSQCSKYLKLVRK